MERDERELRREILMNLIDKKIGRILKAIYEQPNARFYLTQLSEKAQVSLSSTYRILKKLKALRLIREEKIGPVKVYSLERTEQARLLGDILKPSRSIEEIIKAQFGGVNGIKKIVVYGKPQSNRVTLLFVGEIKDRKLIENKKKEIREQNGIIINYLILTEEQYTQMSSLGLYPREKKVLLDKD